VECNDSWRVINFLNQQRRSKLVPHAINLPAASFVAFDAINRAARSIEAVNPHERRDAI
jgi:hypothetical protein